MDPIERAIRTLAVRLGILLAGLPETPWRERPGFIWTLFRHGQSLEGMAAFFERFRERHWPARPGLQQEVWSYVFLTTQNWKGFCCSLFFDYARVLTVEVEGPEAREELQERIAEVLADLPPCVREVAVGLTPYVDQD
jgi:hypothetical protein